MSDNTDESGGFETMVRDAHASWWEREAGPAYPLGGVVIDDWTSTSISTNRLADALLYYPWSDTPWGIDLRGGAEHGGLFNSLSRICLQLFADSLAPDQFDPGDRLILYPGLPGERGTPGLVRLTHVADAPHRGAVNIRQFTVTFDRMLGAARRLRDERLHGKEQAREASLLGAWVLGDEESLFLALSMVRPVVIDARAPEMVPLALPVTSQHGRRSTAGIPCHDAAGRVGLTACFHGTGAVGTSVEIMGQRTQVAAAHEVQDLVFIPVSDVPSPANAIRRIAPGPGLPVAFDGCVSGPSTTHVIASSFGLTGGWPAKQLSVQTLLTASPGDSGCALRDDEGKVMGFAFAQTKPGQPLQFTDWIWADNALDSLSLVPS